MKANTTKNIQQNEQPDKTHVRKEKHRNTLPPFLMVRSGLISNWVFVCMGGCIGASVLYQIPSAIEPHSAHEFTKYACILISIASAGIAIKNTIKHKSQIQDDIKIILALMMEYVNDPNCTISDLSHVRNFPKMTSILLQHMSKHNPGIFDRFIIDPKSISDTEAAQDIIIGHLKKHPEDAPKILELTTNDENSISLSYELQKKINLYTNRLRHAERRH